MKDRPKTAPWWAVAHPLSAMWLPVQMHDPRVVLSFMDDGILS